MPRIPKPLPKFKVGDLVYLAYDAFGMYGKGIILAKHSHGAWEVYWFGERGLSDGFKACYLAGRRLIGYIRIENKDFQQPDIHRSKICL